MQQEMVDQAVSSFIELVASGDNAQAYSVLQHLATGAPLDQPTKRKLHDEAVWRHLVPINVFDESAPAIIALLARLEVFIYVETSSDHWGETKCMTSEVMTGLLQQDGFLPVSQDKLDEFAEDYSTMLAVQPLVMYERDLHESAVLAFVMISTISESEVEENPENNGVVLRNIVATTFFEGVPNTPMEETSCWLDPIGFTHDRWNVRLELDKKPIFERADQAQ